MSSKITTSLERNPMSLAYIIITFLVFIAIIGFIFYVEIITVEYVSATEKKCKNIQPVRAEMIKTFSYIVMAAIILLLLLQLGQVLQLSQVKKVHTCPPPRKGK